MEKQPLFRTEIKPFIAGANPYEENKYESNLRSINHRAILVKTIYLYEGEQQEKMLEGKAIPTQGFMEIRDCYFPDGDRVYHEFLHWGLKDLVTNEDLYYYCDSAVDFDPILAFRMTKVLEELPFLTKDGEPRSYRIYTVTGQANIDRAISHYGKKEVDERKKVVTELIGQDRLKEILLMLPPNPEEIIQTMTENGLSVITSELERELRLGRITMSEFYLDVMKKHYQTLDDWVQALKKVGWI
ncbi:MAG: hypothetical protein V1808_00075 [Candidatus Daviesbacteria bacterium]